MARAAFESIAQLLNSFEIASRASVDIFLQFTTIGIGIHEFIDGAPRHGFFFGKTELEAFEMKFPALPALVSK